MLSFDEFRAVNKREKQSKEQNDRPSTASAASSAKNTNKQEETAVVGGKPSYIGALGDFLETHQIQALYIVLLLVDAFACIAEAQLAEDPVGEIMGIRNELMQNALQSFMGFTLIFFATEIITVLSIFGTSLLGHWGYTADVFFISYQLYLESRGGMKLGRLLNIFRFWRLLRLFNSMVGIERENNERTLEQLDLKDIEIKKLVLESVTLKDQVTKEKEARDSIEDMLQSYRDEVDTLNEALKIAAMDIAEVAQADEDLLDSDMEDDVDFDDELSRTLSLQSSVKAGTLMSGSQLDDASSVGGDDMMAEFSTQKSAIMRAVMDDSRSNNARSARTSSQSTTFLVREDGTFEHK